MPGGARTVPVRRGFTHEGRLQTVEANPLFVRAADGDRPRSGGSVRMRPLPPLLPPREERAGERRAALLQYPSLSQQCDAPLPCPPHEPPPHPIPLPQWGERVPEGRVRGWFKGSRRAIGFGEFSPRSCLTGRGSQLRSLRTHAEYSAQRATCRHVGPLPN